jgi:hypothetical protein
MHGRANGKITHSHQNGLFSIAKPFSVAAGLMLLASQASFASTILVDPSNPNGWAFSNLDNFPNVDATGQFVTGPATPPLGTGSANLTVGDAASSEKFVDTSLAPGAPNFTALSYSTYVTTSTPGSGAAPVLAFDLFEGATYEGRLVFDPGLLGTVVDDTWQSWSAETEDAWYFSHSASLGGDCSITGPTYCSLATAEADLAGFDIDSVDVLFKAGSGQASFDGDVDDLNIAYGDVNDTFNFDPNPAPAPEPASLVLFGAALVGFGVARRRRNRGVAA